MMVNLPLRLTGSGNPGYRIPNTVTITYSNGRILRNVGLIDTSITTSSFTMDMSSGYDSNVNRITNIVGYNGQYLLKYCLAELELIDVFRLRCTPLSKEVL